MFARLAEIRHHRQELSERRTSHEMSPLIENVEREGGADVPSAYSVVLHARVHLPILLAVQHCAPRCLHSHPEDPRRFRGEHPGNHAREPSANTAGLPSGAHPLRPFAPSLREPHGLRDCVGQIPRPRGLPEDAPVAKVRVAANVNLFHWKLIGIGRATEDHVRPAAA